MVMSKHNARKEAMENKQVVLNIFPTLKRLEVIKGRNYTIAEVKDGTGLHRNTVRGLLRASTKRIDLDSLTAFITFFHNEGLKVGTGDLLILTEVESTKS